MESLQELYNTYSTMLLEAKAIWFTKGSAFASPAVKMDTYHKVRDPALTMIKFVLATIRPGVPPTDQELVPWETPKN